jgi:uncharacterized protein (TIGR02391 family)
MAKPKSPSPQVEPPQIEPHKGIELLKRQIQTGINLLQNRPLTDDKYQGWKLITNDFVEKAFGKNSPKALAIAGAGKVGSFPLGAGEQWWENSRATRLTTQIAHLESFLQILETEIQLYSHQVTSDSHPNNDQLWSIIHASIAEVAQQRYRSRHFADAVEASFKHVNSTVKALVRKRTGNEYDGADLMRKAFSPNNPIITLADLSTESGRNEQQGYMDIFAGSMTGIRNPKAHANLNIDENRAIHLMCLASLLMHKLDEIK